MSTTLLNLRRRQNRRPPVPKRVLLFIALLAVGAAGLTFVVVRLPSISVSHTVPWPVVALAMLLAQLAPVRLNTENHTVDVDLFGIPMVVGAVFTTPAELMLSVGLSSFVNSLFRRQYPERNVFNVVNMLIGAALARLALAAVLGSAKPEQLLGLEAVCLAILAFEAWTSLGVLGAVSLSSGAPGWAYLRTVGIQLALTLPLNAVFGLITITVALQETWGMLLLAGPCLGLAVWYRTANTVRSRYANLQLLYGFTVKMADLSDTDEIIATALAETRSVMTCDHAELAMPLGASGVRCKLEGDEPVRRDFSDLTSFERKVIDEGSNVLAPAGSMSVPKSGEFRDLIAVPIQLGDIGCGVVTIANHSVPGETFDTEDLRLFEALAANLSTALTSSQRLDRLRLEVAAREHQALHDSLTGLANRTLFAQWVSTALDRRRHDQLVAVMLLDLDGFKDINDTLGHHTGDSILKEVAGRVLAAIGPDRLAARLGGDEFAFVIPAAYSADEVLATARAVLDSVSRPIATDGLVLELRASLGVAMSPQHGSDPATLLQRADVAMYSAKSSKRGVVAYDREIDQNTKRRLILATELRMAMDAKELEVWYQPVADMDTGQISSLEALLRWRHSDYGSISPEEFIPVAEQTGLIEPLTWWVLETALRELHMWRREGYEITMAINVSARSLLGPEVVDRLGRLLNDVAVPPSSVSLEITESLMMVDPDLSEKVLMELSELGVRIAIDDFGTGYSSLSRLKRLPVQTVKIDRSFVMNMHLDDGDEAIVRATIELAKTMGHVVVAEGVEKQETWDRLQALGCNQVQGYLVAAAMPATECRPWLRSRQQPRMAPVRLFPGVARGA
jgi:diguanylate cyclase (GGDEF)-like protein